MLSFYVRLVKRLCGGSHAFGIGCGPVCVSGGTGFDGSGDAVVCGDWIFIGDGSDSFDGSGVGVGDGASTVGVAEGTDFGAGEEENTTD